MATTFTCPRCFYVAPLQAGVRFCPRCGLADATDAAMDNAPLDLNVGDNTYHVHDRIAIGSICNIYLCRVNIGSLVSESIFKIARDERANSMVTNEARILRKLAAADAATRYAPFLPKIHDSFELRDDPTAQKRHANVLRFDDDISTPLELYSLAEVRGYFKAGLDARDAAWIWRRLLSVVGFAHSQKVIHGAVLPPHVLIEPKGHKLVLIDWCSATDWSQNDGLRFSPISGGYLPWYQRQDATRPTPALDIGLAARCIIDLLGGDAVQGELPPTLEPALKRYFERCLAGIGVDAWKLLEDFDHLIEILWGPRTFRPLAMPPRREI